MKSSVIKCKTANETNKLPGTVYSTNESFARLHMYKALYYNDYRSRKETELMKVTRII